MRIPKLSFPRVGSPSQGSLTELLEDASIDELLRQAKTEVLESGPAEHLLGALRATQRRAWLVKASKAEQSIFRQEVALNPRAPLRVLEALLEDKDATVRSFVLFNPSLKVKNFNDSVLAWVKEFELDNYNNNFINVVLTEVAGDRRLSLKTIELLLQCPHLEYEVKIQVLEGAEENQAQYPLALETLRSLKCSALASGFTVPAGWDLVKLDKFEELAKKFPDEQEGGIGRFTDTFNEVWESSSLDMIEVLAPTWQGTLRELLDAVSALDHDR